ncbi:MAG: SMI1/KNR4 family protein [Planctomycetaceae bacterium]
MKWRRLFEGSAMAKDAENSGGFVFGLPADDDAIRALEQRMRIALPDEFREIYREFDGVGVRVADDEAAWWLVPLDCIAERTAGLNESWFDDAESESLARRMVCFGDWFNGDVFGYLADEDGTIHSTAIHQYHHEVGRIEPWGRTLAEFVRNE